VVQIQVVAQDPAEIDMELEIELKALRALQHEHIVTLYASGSRGGRRFLVLEYLSGGTLAALLDVWRGAAVDQEPLPGVKASTSNNLLAAVLGSSVIEIKSFKHPASLIRILKISAQ
jgi:serine/threonine protein kinase